MKKKTVKLLVALMCAMLSLSLLASCSAMSKDEAGEADIYPSYNAFGKPYPGENVEAEDDNADGAADPDKGDQVEDPTFAENPFISTEETPVSTFSADVDTASYTYFRKLVMSGASFAQLKNNGASFRTEEFINYFRYASAQPSEGQLFGLAADFYNCPWNANTVLMRLTMQAKDVEEPAGNNLVFLIDISGSMRSEDKLPLLKRTFSHLVGNLGENDRVSIVTYSGGEEIVLDGCSGAEDERIMAAINSLVASGSTNGEAGLSEAYRIAEKNFIEGGNNRIIMASDGDLNVGISSEEELKAYISGKRDAGVYLSVLGFGTGNYRDSKMEALADNGNGVYYYIDGESEAEKVFGEDLFSTLYTVAQDVKLQVEFDPARVAAYRLIGYENRLLNQEDFEDDTKDAGEVGSGHQVTVLYEMTLAEGARTEDAWLKLAVRYKNPGESNSLLNEYTLGKAQLRSNISDELRFLNCVVQTAMLLHNSTYLQGTTLTSVLEELDSLDLSEPTRVEFRELIRRLEQTSR